MKLLINKKGLQTLSACVFACMFCLLSVAEAQIVQIVHENFDGTTHPFSVTPSQSTTWNQTTNYYVSGSKSLHGQVPNAANDSLVLQTPLYNCLSYAYVTLRFSHICKISPEDEVRIEYKLNDMGSKWQEIPANTYEGSGEYRNGFSAASYVQWQAGDSLAIPTQAWWKEETFDITNQVSFTEVAFRFIIKKGNTTGTNLNYGWLIDDFQLYASNTELKPPVVEFLPPFVQGTVYSTGPYTINAKVAKRTSAPLLTPYLVYTVSNMSSTTTDSVRMTAYAGDSLWTATLPQIAPNSNVLYYITGRDTTGNNSTITSGYNIVKPNSGILNITDVVCTGDSTATTPTSGYVVYATSQSPTRSRSLYYASELGNTSNPLYIANMAWYNVTNGNNASYQVTKEIKVWMMATADTGVSTTDIRPDEFGATLVYQGKTSSKQYWNQIDFSKAFILPANHNLYVFIESEDPAKSTSLLAWRYTASNQYRLAYKNGTATAWTRQKYLPLIRFGLSTTSGYAKNSVALTAITSPIYGSAIAGNLTPISVNIRNTGDTVLTSANLYHSINGNVQPVFNWTGNLEWDTETSVNIGSYTPTLNKFDTIVTWVAYPNNITDSTTFDDTLSLMVYGCNNLISGDIPIGNGKLYPTIKKALEGFAYCQPQGDVRLLVDAGTYNDSLDFSNFSNIMGRYKLTITSATGNPSDVIVTSSVNSNVIILNNSNNIVFDGITIDASTNKAKGIIFKGACNDVTITNCIIKSDPNTNAAAITPIYKTSSTGIANNINITNNTIDGGYYGIYFYAGTGNAAYGQNIRIENNTISNSYITGIHLYYAHLNSLSGNNLFSRKNGLTVTTYWRGFYVYYVNLDKCDGNHIQNINTNLNYASGGYFYYINDVRYGGNDSTTKAGLFSNNEIIITLNTTNTTISYGLSCNYGQFDIINNSAYLSGAPNMVGLYGNSTTSSSTSMKIYNNNIILTNTTGSSYPINLVATTTYDINYNNYSAPTYIGRFGSSNYTDLNAWKVAVNGDMNSTNTTVTLLDSTKSLLDTTLSLQLAVYDGLDVMRLPNVLKDKQNARRNIITAMGCYQGFQLLQKDIWVNYITPLRNGVSQGTIDSISIIITNVGVDTLQSASFGWTINNVLQTPIVWTGSLATEESDTLHLGTITYADGPNSVVAWLDANTWADNNQQNDTISSSSFACVPLNGRITIGNGGDFANTMDFLTRLNLCGLNGDLEVAYLTGTYLQEVVLNGNTFVGANTYRITFTSAAADKDSVIFQRATAPTNQVAPFMLQNISNICFKHLTLKGHSPISSTYTYSHSIIIGDSCSNITIDSCVLAVPFFTSAITTNSHNAIRIYANLATTSNITITNNNISGGGYGIYAYGSSSKIINNLHIENNYIHTFDKYGIYMYYCDSAYIAHNKIVQRETDFQQTTLNGIYASYCSGDIIGNSIIGNVVQYGIYCAYFNRTTPDFLIANNEIIATNGSGDNAGIYFSTSASSRVYHNSVYMKSTANARGIYITSASGINFDIQNNIFVVNGEGVNSCPIYLTNTTYLAGNNINNNVYYNLTNNKIGYYSSYATDLTTWKNNVTTDSGSVVVMPNIQNPNTSLKLLDSIGISVPALSSVVDDIEGESRDSLVTVAGAYTYSTPHVNVAPLEILGLQPAESAGQTYPISVSIQNRGLDTLTSTNIVLNVNGTTSNHTWTGILAPGAIDTVPLTNVTIISGLNEIVIFTNMPNNVADGFVYDDTVSTHIWGCNGAIHGTYTVGQGGIFTTIQEAISAATYCGLDSAVTFHILPQYLDRTPIVINSIPSTSKTNTITFVPITGDSLDAIVNVSGIAITLNSAAHIYFRNMCFVGGYGSVEMTGICEDIEFRNCLLRTNTTSISNAIIAVNHTSASGANSYLKDVRFIRNTIDGGYYNIKLYYSGSSAATVAANLPCVTIDSNILTNGYMGGIYSYYYNRYKSISYNTITTRSDIAGIQYGIYTYGYNRIDSGIIGNKITLNGTSTSYGIHTYYMNASTLGTTDNALIANNEIRAFKMGTLYGIYINYTKANIYHNSVLGTGTGISYPLYITTMSSSYSADIKNNIFAATSSNASNYPIYCSTASYVLPSYGVKLDYNNYYSNGANIGYVGKALPNNIDSLRAYTQQDEHSVNVDPLFANSNNNLAVRNNPALDALVIGSVPTDIVGNARIDEATMGAYEAEPVSIDAKLVNFVGFNEAIAGVNPISVILTNKGLTDITSATITYTLNGVVQTPIAYTPSTPLAYRHSDTVSLGNLNFIAGINTLSAYVTLAGDTINNNDTITSSRYMCNTIIAGDYTIGSSATADYATWQDWATEAIRCGVANDVTLKFETGTYTDSVTLARLSEIMGGKTLTITSLAANKDSVVFNAGANAMSLLTLEKTNNLVIKDVTLDARNNRYAVNFRNNTNNITFEHCKILAKDTTASTYIGIYKASSTGRLDSLTIRNCEIHNGYYGIYLYPGNGYSSNIIIDSNLIKNNSYSGIYTYYSDLTSLSYNKVIVDRTAKTSTTYYGMNIIYSNSGKIVGNKIAINSNTITGTLYGLRSYYSTKDIIANNELRITSYSTTTYGLYVDYPKQTSYLHNSVYVDGTTTTSSSFLWYVYSNANYDATVSKNLFVNKATGTNAYAIRFNGTYSGAYDTNYRINGNAYFSTSKCGYVNSSDKQTLSDWLTVVQSDSNSVFVEPIFNDVNTDLTLKAYGNVLTDRDSLVLTDISGTTRHTITACGAYDAVFPNTDAALTEFVYDPIIVQQPNPISVKVFNNGYDTLKTLTINWSLNGVQQPAVNWTGALSLTQQETISLGNIVPPTGLNTLRAWISLINGSGTDDDNSNDTISDQFYACAGALAGYYTVGTNTSDFATLDEFRWALNTCGVGDTTTFAFANGNYDVLKFETINGLSDTTPITITSISGNAADVNFIANLGDAITLNNIGNMNFRHVTFDASRASNAVQLLGQITNVEFYGCNIKASPTATASTSNGIRYYNATTATQTLTNVRFIKNNISGGYYNIYCNYAAGSAANILTRTCSITIDSNNMENAYYAGIYSTGNSIYTSIAYNNITTKTTNNVTTVQYGMYMTMVTVDSGIVGNKILLQGCRSTTGMYISGFNATARAADPNKNGLIANNEIRRLRKAEVNSVTATGLAIYSPSRADVYHNSIYIQDTCSVRTLQFTTSTEGNLNIRNNILAVNSDKTATSYAVYVGTATHATPAFNTTMDYNNYYNFRANDNLAYIGSNVSTFADLRTKTMQDNNSVNIAVSFANAGQSLKLNNYYDVLVPNVGINQDIEGNVRKMKTTMGAYTPIFSDSLDLSIVAIEGLPDSTEMCSPDFATIDIIVKNSSGVDVDFATQPLTLYLHVSGKTQADTSILIDSGSLEMLKQDTFRLLNNLNIYPSGNYLLQAWLQHSDDHNTLNDTLSVVYTTNKVILPMDENFAAGMPATVRSIAEIGSNMWTVMHDSDATGTVVPQFGNAMIAFNGNRGEMTHLFTQQLDLNGSSEPVLDFWYYHDTSANASTLDYTDIRLTFDGALTYQTLFSVRKNNGVDMGWKQYTYKLDSFINQSCIVMVFEAMRMSDNSFNGEQYIDRIRITSNQDLAIDKMLVPTLTACDYKGKELSAVISAATAQNIDFSKYPTLLKVDVSGQTAKSYVIQLDSGVIAGLNSDTLLLDSSFDFNPGNYFIHSYIVNSIDNIPGNDVRFDTIVVNPQLDIQLTKITDGTNCIPARRAVSQQISVTNNGNMDMEDLILKLEVSNSSGAVVETLYDTLFGVLAMDSQKIHTFTKVYTVPDDEQYNVSVNVYPMCNTDLSFQNVINECIDLNDLVLEGILVPTDDGQCMRIGSQFNVKIKVTNKNPDVSARQVDVYAAIEDNDGNILASWTENIDEIYADDYTEVEFQPAFTVVAVPNFTIRAYLVGNSDINSDNDTAAPVSKCTDLSITDNHSDGISMSQNIPNPTTGQTKVLYTVPQEGKVLFNISTVTGQIIYREETMAESGENSIEFNTEHLAAGIYFYSMTYNGHKIVKKMTVGK